MGNPAEENDRTPNRSKCKAEAGEFVKKRRVALAARHAAAQGESMGQKRSSCPAVKKRKRGAPPQNRAPHAAVAVMKRPSERDGFAPARIADGRYQGCRPISPFERRS